MKFIIRFVWIFVCIGFMSLSVSWAQIPYYFIENQGQFENPVKYKAQVEAGHLFVEEKGYTLSFYNNLQMGKVWSHKHEKIDSIQVDFHAVRIEFLHAHAAQLAGLNTFKTYHNYYLGNDESKWKSKVPLHAEVYFQKVYDNIDFRFYNEANKLKSDWILHPGADVQRIQMAYVGHKNMHIKNGNLIVQTTVNTIEESKPYAYQVIDGTKREIPCRYILTGDAVSFHVGQYDPNIQLIIDPILVFSTYSGARGDNFGFTATYDSESNLYAGGIINNRAGEYPVTPGAYQQKYGGGIGTSPVNLACDISISKYDSSGSNLLYATYLGGAGDEYPHSLVVDNNDKLIVFGTSNSSDFPVVKTSYDTLYNGGYDIIVSKFAVDGTKLIGSTYIGGGLNDGLNTNPVLRYNYADDFRGDVIVDNANHVFIASTTFSKDLPVVRGFQAVNNGGHDGCLFELSADLDKLIWSTYVGGSSADALYSIKLDVDYIYAGGGTNSNNLDTTGSVLFKKNQGGVDGFLVKVNKSTKTLDKLSYWGGSAYDQIYFIEIDSRKSLYIAGQTESSFPKSSGTYGKKDKGQFVARLTLDLDSIFWQTTFGNRDNRPDISPSAFLVDKCNHIYMSGWGSNVDPGNHPGSTEGLEITATAIQKTTDNNDFYLIVMDQDARGLLYATYFGGDSSEDHVDGGTSRFDKRGVVYQSVCSSCPPGSQPGLNDFPVTPDAAFIRNVSPRCSNASFKIDLQTNDAVIALFTADPIESCKPLNVTFTNQSSKAKRFFWDFGDGTFDTIFNPPKHMYEKPGEYIVTLTALDSLSCNITNKYEQKLTVRDKPKADFSYLFDGCNEELKIKNNSQGGFEYDWSFGDGNTSIKDNPVHQYKVSGVYKITLIANPNTQCPDTFFKNVQVDINAGSDFVIPNVFTPNEDNKNDCFKVQGLNPNCDEMEWFIYNRWGECIFHSTDMNACWDGNNELGHPYPAGAYFAVYKMKIKGKIIETISGTVTLIR